MSELYKRYRPKTFDRVVGNEETVEALQEMVTRGAVPHTVLFSGPSGCGKTTLARILAMELGCSEFDYKEINSANFRGVDTVRDIAKTMQLSPASGMVRVWVLDEVQKMTTDGQNAALKILEDTPEHVYFFLCTTDPQKLIKAILSRCSPMPVRDLSLSELGDVVRRVAKKENISLKDETFETLVRFSGGSPRVALVLLDKIANLPEAKREAAMENVVSEENKAIDLCRLLMKKGVAWTDITKVVANIKEEPENVRRMVMGYARAVLLKADNYQAYLVIDCFRHNFFDSGEAGLIRACYEVLHAK